MNTIEVWRPKIAIPTPLSKAVANYKWRSGYNDKYRFRDDYGADPTSVAGLHAIFTDGVCDWHNDDHIDNQYSLLFVVRNETGSYIESKGVPPVLEQPVGTMVLLDIWHEHRLWNPEGNDSPVAVYLALCIDLKERLSKRECEQRMRAVIKSLRVPSPAVLSS